MAGLSQELLGQELTAYIERQPNIFGGADIYNYSIDSPLARAGLLASVLSCLVDADRRPAVRRFVIVVPPGSGEEYKAKAWAEFASSFRFVRDREMGPDEHARPCLIFCFRLMAVVSWDQA